MITDGIDFASALSNEFILPTNGSVGASRVSGEDGLCPDMCPLNCPTQHHVYFTADRPCTYLAGNSLGALSKRSERLVQEELHAWATV